MSSEKDIKAVRSTMRLSRKRFDDPALKRYNDFLTPFVFKKVEEQFEFCFTLRIDLQQVTETTFETQNGFFVTKESCSCTFFSAMQVPCRHIFKLLQFQGCDLFVPTLCLERWTKAYYNASHPSLIDFEQRTVPQPVSLQRIRVPDEISKYKKAANLTKDINNIAASMATSEYEFYLGKMECLKNEMINARQKMPNRSDDQQNEPAVVSQQASQPAGNAGAQIRTPPIQSTPVARQTMPNRSDDQQNAPAVVSQQASQPAGNTSAQIQTPPIQSTPVARQAMPIRSDDQQNAPAVVSQQASQPAGNTSAQIQTPPIQSTPVARQTMPIRSDDQQNAPAVVSEQASQPAGNTSAQIQTPPIQSTPVARQTMPIRSDDQQNAPAVVSQQASQPAGNTSAQIQTPPIQSTPVSRQTMPNQSDDQQNAPAVVSQQASQASNGTLSQSQSNSTVRSNIAIMKLPNKIVSVGRPKGSGQTVIGTKKKPTVELKRRSNEKVDIIPAKKKFMDLNSSEKSIKIVQWLTNKPASEIERRKVTYSDLIQDSNVFNRLRNDGVTLNDVKKFVDQKCFKYLSDEIKRLKHLIWGCSKCKRNLSGDQIMCVGCLDWYHLNCVKKGNDASFFCDDCNRA